MTPDTDILLGTYNGAAYLGGLLASLDAQTDQDWRLVARDDGSTDATVRILADWGETHPGRLRMIRDDRGNLGALANFSALLATSEADRFLFCDQDDVWLQEKIARMQAAMTRAEAQHGRGTPVLVLTDVTVTDSALKPLGASFRRHQQITWPDPDEPWKVIAIQNIAPGCAMMGNAALRRAALPVPAEAIMHDWWVALVAAAMGRIVDDPEPSTLYRQHGGNVRGAGGWTTASRFLWVLQAPARAIGHANRVLSTTQAQARILAARHAGRMDPRAERFLKAYGDLPGAGLGARKSFPFRHGLWFGNPVRDAGLILCI